MVMVRGKVRIITIYNINDILITVARFNNVWMPIIN